MSFIAAIDLSTFIWCEKDFNLNKKQYIILKNLAPKIYTQIKDLKLPILLRNELYQTIMNEFPYNMVKEIGYDFQNLTLDFLTETFLNWSIYNEDIDESVTSIPEISKTYFSSNIKVELQSQVCHLFHNNQNPEHKFITFNYFFNNENNLLLNKENNNVVVGTLHYSTEKEIEDFFSNFKIKFEHNPKHRSEVYYDYERQENVSPFSCYHNQGEAKAQVLLDNSILHNGHYYNFDLENNVFVRFIKTINLIYHGHDLFDEGNNIPNDVKKKFSK
jgi:hypothetical protein